MFLFLLWSMTSSVIDFTVLECNERGVTEQKWADLRILSDQVRYGWTQGQIQEETMIHIQQIQ